MHGPRHILRLASPLLAVAALLIAAASPSFVEAQVLESPRLEVLIPSVEFSQVVKSDQDLTVPWLAQYLVGATRFLTSIVGVVASVMIAIGGFQYLTAGGDKTRVEAGRKRIENALIGLVLALGAYVLLYAINPRLLAFQGISLLQVRTESVGESIDRQMGDTNSNTALSEVSPPLAPGELVYEFTTCPFTYEASHKEEYKRKKEFIAKAPPYITKTGIRDRIVQAAQLADVCNPVLGSCGTTVGTIIALAYKGNPNYEKMSKRSDTKNADCLDPSLAAGKGADGPFDCNGFSLGTRLELGSKLRREQYGRNCTIDQVKENRDERDRRIKAGKLKVGEFLTYSSVRCDETVCTSNGVNIPRTPCAKTDTDARKEFVKIVQDAGIKGYPDEWAKSLKAGDYVNIYNGNTDLTGGHAILFMGWANDKEAYVVQGGGGCVRNAAGQLECKVARPGKTCLMEACGGEIRPITSIMKVE